MENQKVKDNNASGEFWGRILFFYFISLVPVCGYQLFDNADMIDGVISFLWYLIVTSVETLLWPILIWF